MNNTTAVTGCLYEFVTISPLRFGIFVVVSPVISVIGVLGNFVSIIVFCQPHLRNSNNLLLCFLAVCDIGVLVSAVMLYTVEVAYDHYRNAALYSAWMEYLKVMFFLSNSFQIGSAYFTVAATVERWYATAMHRVMSNTSLWITIISVFFFSFAINIVRYFEIIVQRAGPSCPSGFGSYWVSQAEFVARDFYQEFVSIWIWGTVSLIVPFLVLTVLNVIVIYRFNDAGNEFSRIMAKAWTPKPPPPNERVLQKSPRFRAKQKEATKILILVVSIFLLCNLPGFLLTTMEKVAKKYLHSHPELYSCARDVVNFMAIIECSLGFFIYVIFGQEFRYCSLTLMIPTGMLKILFEEKPSEAVV